MNANGYDVVGSPAQQMSALRAAFRDRRLSFRYLPQSRIPSMRWQAGRVVVEPITLADGSVQLLERFELIGFASTSRELTEQLA
jgi:hypothetical protein